MGVLSILPARLRWVAALAVLLIAPLAVVPSAEADAAGTEAGTVWAWGYNSDGQLGDGTTVERHHPVRVTGLQDVTAVASGSSTAYALRSDGTVWAWGNNRQGQFGDGTTVSRPAPVQVLGITDVVGIAATGNAAIALRADGTLWAWGSNVHGYLGFRTTGDNVTTPVQVPGLVNIVAIRAENGAVFALCADGTVWAWGDNYMGQLGTGYWASRYQTTPLKVVTWVDGASQETHYGTPLTEVVSVFAGSEFTFYALRSDGSVWDWGRETGQRNYAKATLQVGLSGVTAIAGGSGSATYVLRSDDGSVWSWPRTGGNGVGVTRAEPSRVLGLTGVVGLAASGGSGYAVRANGTVWSWGSNRNGRLGDGTTVDRSAPVQVLGLANATEVVAGPYGGYAVVDGVPMSGLGSDRDTDGDGLPDSWECATCYVPGTSLSLYSMGARVDRPDLFLELDWMVRPEERALGFLWVERPWRSYKPSAESLRRIQEAFWEYGYAVNAEGRRYDRINLHIDAGPDSVMDYADPSKPKWGSLSGGGEVPFSNQAIVTDGGSWAKLEDVLAGYYDNDQRGKVFRYGLMADKAHKNWTGIANTRENSDGSSAGGCCFIVGTGYLDDRDLEMAGTVMHEFGHTIGLRHGGGDDVNYKPNYLSVMNYSHQLTGMGDPLNDSRSNRVNYSRWKLNDLNEYWLLERDGLSGAGFDKSSLPIVTHWACPDGRPRQSEVRWMLDFNCNGVIDSEPVEVNLNPKDESGSAMDTLVSHDDWKNIVFLARDMGAGSSAGVAASVGLAPPGQSEELTMEDALANDVLGLVGDGALEAVGPFSVIAGEPGQRAFVRVNNLSWSPGEWTVSATGELLAGDYSESVSVAGSNADGVAHADVAIPFLDDPQPGTYTVELVLTGASGEQGRLQVPVEVFAPTQEQRADLLAAIEAGELNVDPLVSTQLRQTLAEDVAPTEDLVTVRFFGDDLGVAAPGAVTVPRGSTLQPLPSPICQSTGAAMAVGATCGDARFIGWHINSPAEKAGMLTEETVVDSDLVVQLRVSTTGAIGTGPVESPTAPPTQSSTSTPTSTPPTVTSTPSATPSQAPASPPPTVKPSTLATEGSPINTGGAVLDGSGPAVLAGLVLLIGSAALVVLRAARRE